MLLRHRGTVVCLGFCNTNEVCIQVVFGCAHKFRELTSWPEISKKSCSETCKKREALL